MNIKIMKRGLVHYLFLNVGTNLDRYLKGDFEDIIESDDFIREIKNSSYNEELLEQLDGTVGSAADATNAEIIYNAFQGLSPYMARDERIWVYLTHTKCLEFTRERWLKNISDEEKLVSSIKSHFFARGGERGFERNNALSSLWWGAYIADFYKDEPLGRTLKAFLTHTDVRASIIERPNTSFNKNTLSGIMSVLIRKYYVEEDEKFFSRVKNKSIYREWLKLINRYGGGRLLDSMDKKEAENIINELAAEAEKSFRAS